MENNLIIFGSVTLAMKSRNLLLKNNIKSGLVRTPIHLNRKSCGYSLYVPGNLKRRVLPVTVEKHKRKGALEEKTGNWSKGVG